MLAKPPAEIRLSHIAQAVGDSVMPVRCIDEPELCLQSNMCPTRGVWTEMGRAINKVLQAATLHDLVSQQKERQQSKLKKSFKQNPKR